MKKITCIFIAFSWCLLLLAGFMVYGSSGHDDPHINFWFSHTLLEYGQLVNYNGDRVEQTTSLLLVLLTAFFTQILPFDLVTCGYLVDIVSVFFCCLLITFFAKRFCPALAAWPAWLMLASTSFLLWTFGGMGAALAAFTLLCAAFVWWFYVESLQQRITHFVSLVAVTLALVLVRPEMPLVIVTCAILLLFLHLKDEKRRVRFLHIFLANLVGTILIFSWQKLYFSSWLPLPVIAKQVGETSLWARLDLGFLYLAVTSLVNPVILLAIFFALFAFWVFYKQWKGNVFFFCPQPVMTALLILGSFLGVYCGFVAAAGGDWMQCGRFLVPVIPLASLLVVVMMSLWIRRLNVIRCVLLLLIFSSVSFVPVLVARESHGIPVWVQYRLNPAHESYSVFEKYNQEHLRDLAVIDHLSDVIPRLHQKLNRPVRLLSGQAGMVFYTLGQDFYGQVDFSDLRGLVEGRYTMCPFLQQVDRNSMGLAWDYAQYFAMWPILESECKVAPPDIIYDLKSPFYNVEAVMNAAGYSLVHQEMGFAVSNNTNLAANTLYTPNLIFVRNDLMPLLGNPEKTVIDYLNVPLLNRAERFWR